MASTSTLPLVDRLIPGGLEQFLAETRGRGDSFQTVVLKLREQHGITRSAPTIKEWCEHYGITKPDEAVAS